MLLIFQLGSMYLFQSIVPCPERVAPPSPRAVPRPLSLLAPRSPPPPRFARPPRFPPRSKGIIPLPPPLTLRRRRFVVDWPPLPPRWQEVAFEYWLLRYLAIWAPAGRGAAMRNLMPERRNVTQVWWYAFQ